MTVVKWVRIRSIWFWMRRGRRKPYPITLSTPHSAGTKLIKTRYIVLNKTINCPRRPKPLPAWPGRPAWWTRPPSKACRKGQTRRHNKSDHGKVVPRKFITASCRKVARIRVEVRVGKVRRNRTWRFLTLLIRGGGTSRLAWSIISNNMISSKEMITSHYPKRKRTVWGEIKKSMLRIATKYQCIRLLPIWAEVGAGPLRNHRDFKLKIIWASKPNTRRPSFLPCSNLASSILTYSKRDIRAWNSKGRCRFGSIGRRMISN